MHFLFVYIHMCPILSSAYLHALGHPSLYRLEDKSNDFLHCHFKNPLEAFI